MAIFRPYLDVETLIVLGIFIVQGGWQLLLRRLRPAAVPGEVPAKVETTTRRADLGDSDSPETS